MKKFNFMAVVAGLLILGSPAALRADDTSDNKPAEKPSPELREKLRNMSQEERKQWIKDHPEVAKRIQQSRGNFEKNKPVLERAGIKPEELKDLSPAERRAKVKEAVDARIADLEKKKTNGNALTEQEQSDLDALNQMKSMMDRAAQHGAGHKAKAHKAAADDSK